MLQFDQVKRVGVGRPVLFPEGPAASFSCFDSPDYVLLPGFCDVHVHFREPGFSYKETIASGTRAAARGGFTEVCTMPNLDPVPDDLEHLRVQEERIAQHACIRVHPYASITAGEKGAVLADLESLADRVIAFSDDGRGVQSEQLMRDAMMRAKALGKLIVAHCEDNSLLNGGYIHDGAYAAAHGHRGICSKSEWGQVERDLKLAEETGCAYHICHVSTKESVSLIRDAKRRGVDVTCETAPHYLLLDETDLCEDGRFKMNPPLRAPQDREALVEGLLDGTVDMIATDHAPHSAEEKGKGLAGSAFGVVGIETAFPLLYTGLVRTRVLSLAQLVNLFTVNPRKRFGLQTCADYAIWDLNEEYEIDPAHFLSKGRATPFSGRRVFGRCLLTVCDGKAVYNTGG